MCATRVQKALPPNRCKVAAILQARLESAVSRAIARCWRVEKSFSAKGRGIASSRFVRSEESCTLTCVRRMRTSLSIAMTLLLVSGGWAQDQPGATVNLAGQIDIPRLVDLSSQRLKLNVEYDANALKAAGLITLRLDAGLSDDELWMLTNRVLVAHGFVTVRVSGKAAFAIVKLADAPNVAGVTTTVPGELVPGYRTTVVRAKHRSAKELTEVVARVLSKPGGTVVALREGAENGLIQISDVATRVDQAVALVEQIDVATVQSRVEEIPVRNFTAQQLATAVAQVNEKREQVSGQKIPGEVIPSTDGSSVLLICDPARSEYWKSLVTQLDRRERTETVTYSPKSFPARDVAKLVEEALRSGVVDDRWRLFVDELTGSLIITATPTQHEQIKAMVDRLDTTLTGSKRPVRSFVIRNRPVKEIQATLEQLVQSGVLASEPSPNEAGSGVSAPAGASPWPPKGSLSTPSSNTTRTASSSSPPSSQIMSPTAAEQMLGSRSAGGYLPGSAPKSASSDLSISSDEGTNTLIVMGEPRLLAQIDSLLQTLDIRQPQVMLEVLILSLSESQTLDLGVELEKLSGGETRTRVSSLFGLSTRDSVGNVSAGSGLGLTGVVLDPGDFSVVLRALQTLNNGRSLSMPRLLVTNNQQATLDSILEQPYASTNASNTVTTTSFGGSKPAGTQLTLKPQITGGAGGGEGDHLLLDYNVSLSAFVGAAANSSLPPPRQENKLQSVASLPDGHTVVVGGIELTTDGKATNQVPGLGSIPVIGELFKSRSNNSSRSRFYVFIRANILRARGFEDLRYLGEVAASQVGIDDGWPVVEARVIR